MSNDDDDKRDSAPDESSNDEASSKESSSHEASDDESSSESESSESSSSSTAEASEPRGESASTSDATGKGSRMSAGARLAAAKAAKAVVKASKKEERKAASQTDVVEAAPEEAPAEAAPADPVKELEESELGRAALRAGKWWESNQQMGWIAVAVAAIAIVGFLGWQYHKDTTSAAVGVLLEDAIEIASARVVPEGEEPAADDDDEDDGEEPERTFTTRAERDEAALTAYQAIVAQYPDHASSGIARLGAARALLALGRNDEAEAMYQQAFDRNGRSGVVAWQALEGVGFAQEAAGNPTEAQATYERLGNLQDHAYEQVANYHLARLMLARGERDEARTALRELVDSLRADTVEGSSEPRFPYLLSQAEVRLRELDPSSATSAGPSLLGPGGPGGGLGGQLGGQLGGGEGGEIDPAQLQELIRQFQERQQQGGGPPEGGEGGGE